MAPIIEKLIDAAPSLVSAAISVYVVRQVQKVHVSINSRFDEWMEATKKSSYAEGKLAGKKEKRNQ